MTIALIDTFSDEDFINIVNSSYSMTEIALKLGYAAHSGSNATRIRERIDELGLSTQHFSRGNRRLVKRNEENVFIENSTASQKTLRLWYKKGEYTPYICSICGQEPFWQGKDLTLILDHINGHNHDDRLENLRWVCPNCNQQLDTTGAKNINKLAESSQEKHYCIDCGKEISYGGTRCRQCNGKLHAVPLENMPVTREELKQLIRTKTFVDIGKQFNVADNSIRKWCDKFNLPRKKKDINSYSDEEWEKI